MLPHSSIDTTRRANSQENPPKGAFAFYGSCDDGGQHVTQEFRDPCVIEGSQEKSSIPRKSNISLCGKKGFFFIILTVSLIICYSFFPSWRLFIQSWRQTKDGAGRGMTSGEQSDKTGQDKVKTGQTLANPELSSGKATKETSIGETVGSPHPTHNDVLAMPHTGADLGHALEVFKQDVPLSGAGGAAEFANCFIAESREEREFRRSLHEYLQSEKLRIVLIPGCALYAFDWLLPIACALEGHEIGDSGGHDVFQDNVLSNDWRFSSCSHFRDNAWRKVFGNRVSGPRVVETHDMHEELTQQEIDPKERRIYFMVTGNVVDWNDDWMFRCRRMKHSYCYSSGHGSDEDGIWDGHLWEKYKDTSREKLLKDLVEKNHLSFPPAIPLSKSAQKLMQPEYGLHAVSDWVDKTWESKKKHLYIHSTVTAERKKTDSSTGEYTNILITLSTEEVFGMDPNDKWIWEEFQELGKTKKVVMRVHPLRNKISWICDSESWILCTTSEHFPSFVPWLQWADVIITVSSGLLAPASGFEHKALIVVGGSQNILQERNQKGIDALLKSKEGVFSGVVYPHTLFSRDRKVTEIIDAAWNNRERDWTWKKHYFHRYIGCLDGYENFRYVLSKLELDLNKDKKFPGDRAKLDELKRAYANLPMSVSTPSKAMDAGPCKHFGNHAVLPFDEEQSATAAFLENFKLSTTKSSSSLAENERIVSSGSVQEI